MASAQTLLLASGVQREEVGRTEQLSEDEFACPGEARELLLSVQPLVERIFGVTFDVGVTEKELLPRNEQIWVKMKGMKSEVEAAKLFVKGLMSQEEWQEMSYPQALHCVFTGAQGLFMDCLIKNTSANIEVGPAGSLLISGLAEQVVQAYSFVYNLVEKYKTTQGRHAEPGSSALHESLDSRLAFKALVEQREDQYTLDLLVLPGAVKEILLNMVKDSRLDRQLEGTRAIARKRCRETERFPLQDMETLSPGCNMSHSQGGSSSEKSGVFMEGALQHSGHQIPQVTVHHGIPSWSHQPQNQSVSRVSDEGKGPSSGGERVRKGEEVRDTDLPRPAFCNALSKIGNQGRAEFGERVLGHVPQEVGEEDGLEGLSLSVGSRKEFSLQLNFFTAMGYSEHVVRRVLDRTGPTEVSQILDQVQQEQDREAERERDLEPKGGPADDGRREEGGAVARANGGEEGSGRGWRVAPAPKMLEDERDGDGGKLGEDYVLTVLKKAAASCGYTEERVMEVYTNLPGLSVGELLLELQKGEQRSKGGDRAGGHMEPRRGLEQDGKAEEQEVERRSRGRSERNQDDKTRESSPDGVGRPATAGEPIRFHSPRRHTQVRGPPGATYPEKLPSVKGHVHGALRAEERPWPGDVTRNSVVTGEQRFCDGLSMPFSLKLTDEPGDPGLRQVIIDGSNVAMSHGLGHFFSCRGIALAVQYFWKQGHRSVTTFVPQWRLKKDPKVKERHYLTDLQNLGLLSFTPSREVEGMRINSYDDRFMLQLAQRTDGVIVTNDNLRDLVDESPAWRDIIKKSLLQYTFVGDHFMVPDDPLGRGGPHLKEFLRTQHRSANPGSHTFAGTASAPHPPTRPHAQTEVLRYRDRTLGGAPSKGGPGESDGMKLWEKGRGRGRGRAKVEAGEVGMDRERSSEQTCSLRERLARVFPGQDSSVTMALACNPSITDINVLSDIILELLDEKGREV